MKTLIPLAVILAVSLVLAEEPPPPPPPGPGPPGPEPPGPEPPGPQPPGPQPPGDKHELQVCLDKWNACVESTEGDDQFGCIPKYYECLNAYTRICRKKFRNQGCFEALGKEECMRRLKICYGHKPE
ncbi:anthrax toxin receptor-like [Stylophora pistillata]|uniref:anthrax toxin receptor-like n=1 Tax=Stylophora pistillata TaxID=50429 RepID=UPI000C0482AF|nr:anthrax toxin receptor-like [Stylophora pistillata]